MLWPMEPKDSFMRFVVIGSIVVVGAFALFITLRIVRQLSDPLP